MTDVNEKARAFLAKRLEVSQNEIADDADLFDSLGIDSLDFVELMTYLEDVYQIEVPEDQILQLRTIEGIADHLRMGDLL